MRAREQYARTANSRLNRTTRRWWSDWRSDACGRGVQRDGMHGPLSLPLLSSAALLLIHLLRRCTQIFSPSQPPVRHLLLPPLLRLPPPLMAFTCSLRVSVSGSSFVCFLLLTVFSFSLVYVISFPLIVFIRFLSERRFASFVLFFLSVSDLLISIFVFAS